MENGQLQSIIIVHFDDFLWAGTPKFLKTVEGPFKSRLEYQNNYILSLNILV